MKSKRITITVDVPEGSPWEQSFKAQIAIEHLVELLRETRKKENSIPKKHNVANMPRYNMSFVTKDRD